MNSISFKSLLLQNKINIFLHVPWHAGASTEKAHRVTTAGLREGGEGRHPASISHFIILVLPSHGWNYGNKNTSRFHWCENKKYNGQKTNLQDLIPMEISKTRKQPPSHAMQQDGGCAGTLMDDQVDTLTDDHASTWKRWAHWGLLGWEARRVSRQLHQFWTNDSVSWRPLLLGSSTLGPLKISQEGFRNDLCFQKEKSKPIQAEQTPGSSLAPRNKRKPFTLL